MNKTLKESEERWQFAIEGNGNGLWDWNIQTNEVFYSKQYKAMLGFEDDEIENKLEEWEKRVHPDDKAAAYLDIQNHLEGKTEIYNNEYRLKCKNGTYKWIEDRGKVISRTENNKPLRFIGTLRDITEQKQAEYHIQESEEKYKALFNNAPLSYQSLDEQGFFIDINPSWLRTLGYEHDEVIGKDFADFLHPDWKPHFEKNFPAFKKRGYVNDVQYKIKHKKGHFIDISFEGCIGYLPDGSFKQTYCVFQDITEKKKAEKLLLESEEKYKQLYESNQMPISIFDTKTLKFLSVNSAFVEKYGYTEEEFLKMTILDIRPDTETPKVKQSVSKIDNGLTNAGVFLHKKKNGEIIQVEIIRYDLVFEGKNAKLVFANDITDRIQAEEKLMESEEKFRTFVNTASDLMCITNKDGQLTDVNSAMADVLDYSTEELKEMHISNLLTEEALKNDFNPNWEKFIKDGEIKIETTFKTKGGNEIPGELKAIAIYNNSGKLKGTRAVFIDLTKYKHAKDELRKQKEIFELVINSVPIRIFWKDLNSVYLGCNQAFAEASGPQKIEAVIGKNDFDLIWAEEAEKYIKDDRQVINSGIPKIAYDEDYITPDGKKVWWSSSKMPLKDSNGNIFGIIATSEDVTKRKHAEEELAKHREHLEELIKARTAELEEKNKELERFNKLFVGRELKMVELKEKINELKSKLK